MHRVEQAGLQDVKNVTCAQKIRQCAYFFSRSKHEYKKKVQSRYIFCDKCGYPVLQYSQIRFFCTRVYCNLQHARTNIHERLQHTPPVHLTQTVREIP